MGSSLASVKAVVFDLDDTLCGYWDASKAGLRAAFEQHGPGHLSPDEMLRHWARAFRRFCGSLKETPWYEGYLDQGEPTRTEQMRLCLLEAGVDDPARAARMSETYMVERDRNLRLFDDARATLDALRARFPLGLLTNGPADIQRQEISTTGIEAYFDHILIEGELRMGKPKPEVFQEAERRFGCGPSEMLMVGNSYHHDIKGAIRAGWRTVWIRRPSDVAPSADGAGVPESRPDGDPVPDHEIGDLATLVDLLQ